MNSADHELIEFLQAYIQIPTCMPAPCYDAVGELFARQAAADGFSFTKHVLPSGYPCFVVTVRGSDPALQSLVLNHHMDVVPVLEPSAWSVDPFVGALVGDSIIGRGVQDTKGLGVVHYFALREFLREGYQLRRTVHLLIVPDEECGGFRGTQELIKQPFFKELNVGYVCDEGPSSGHPKELLIKIDERKPLQLRISTSGVAGHGSHLHIDNAIHRLARIIEALVTYQHAQREKSKSVHDAGAVTSLNITSIVAGDRSAYNVVPATADATIDIRIAPSESYKAIIAMIEAICAREGGICTVLATVPEREYKQDLSQNLVMIAQSMLKKYGMHLHSIISEGASDLRFYWERGIAGIGFAPFISPYNAHGIDESLTVAELIQAKDIMKDLIVALCCKD